jgi:hypothetical protein
MSKGGYDSSAPYQTTYSIPPPRVGLFYPAKPAPCAVSGYTKPYAP